MFDELKQELLFVAVLFEVVAIWVVSDLGYYYVSVLSGGNNYSSRPLLMAAYYLFWVCITLAMFWRFYKKEGTTLVHHSTYPVLLLGIVGVASYLLYIFPFFQPIHWAIQWKPPTELLTASPWYFLPKSIEIALQQLLVAAMVLAFHMRKLPLADIAWWSAVLFGGMHLLLVLNGSSFAYVIVFTAAATAAGYVFPYLMLRVRNGFLYSYFLHWGFYALVIVLVRLVYAA